MINLLFFKGIRCDSEVLLQNAYGKRDKLIGEMFKKDQETNSPKIKEVKEKKPDKKGKKGSKSGKSTKV